MSAPPVPLLRQPTPGQRNANGSRPPRLGLSIPGSPAATPVNNPPVPQHETAPLAKPTPPPLRLSTPHGGAQRPGRPTLSLQPLPTASSVSIDSQFTENSRSGSIIDTGYISSSAASSVSLSLRTGDPHSATSGGGGSPSARSMTDGMSMKELEAHLDQLKISLDGRDPDVQDLDDDGWQAVSKSGKIVEIGSLGEGAGGAVTRCMLKGGKTVFALKVITTNPDPDVKKQILREIRFNKTCASDHICRYFGAFDDSSGTISIAMEFCEGGSLDSVYKECKRLGGRAGEKVLGKVAEGVLRGLHYLNSLHILHRDIKPSNILLCRDGQVKLCDFGVSGEFGTKGDANTFIGTSYYMAPERITGQRYKINSDVWSLGVTLLEVAQHRFPFPADGTEMQPRAGLIDLLTYIVRQPTPILKDEPDSKIKWPQTMKDFIAKCMIKDPELRPDPLPLLEEPWMKDVARKNVNMEQFLTKVWDWKD